MTWTSTRLKFLADLPIRNGLGEAGEFEDPSWPRYVRTTDIAGPRSLREDSFKSLPPEVARKAMLLPGDILMTAAGATIGKSYLHLTDGPACFAGYLARFRARSDIDARFVAYWMQSTPYWDQIAVGAVRSTIDNFSAGRYQNLTLSVPDLDEQRRIADFLDHETARIDRLTARLRDMLGKVQEKRSAYVHASVTGAEIEDREQTNLPWASDLPSTWPAVRVTYVARLGSGHTPSRSRPDWWTDCYIPWITTGEVQQVRDDRLEVLTETRETISDLGLANSAAELHPAGTVVLCRTASAGYSAVMGRDMATSQDFATWTCGPRLHPYYLLWCLRAMRPDLLGRLAMGSTHKTIYMPDIQSIRIPLPPIENQREIVTAIRRSNERHAVLNDVIERQQSLLDERRKALITAAVTGQLDVTTARGAR